MVQRLVSLFVTSLITTVLCAQDYRWQQRVEYAMDVKLDVNTHRVHGVQKLVYYNNSPDTLYKVYYHLYFNAFQPGSMMDVRSTSISDPDRRVADRISKLRDDEIGYQHILSLKQDGKDVLHRVDQTILEVTLVRPLLPKTKTLFEMAFESQVPLQIRRSGRDNREGIAYSMAQWYPKIAEYDFQGWHAYQYVGREFHGVWGDYDVKITIDPRFVIGGTGKLLNPETIGDGYEKPGMVVKRLSGDLTWHFVATDVIDFAWAADPDYTHEWVKVPNGPELHFFFQENEKTTQTWREMQEYVIKAFQFLSETFGKYPYDQYSVIQGGDGATEYPMCTMILGEGQLNGMLNSVVHEVAHSWYQSALATNESLYAWMDEGFANFARDEAMAILFRGTDPHEGSYRGYFAAVSNGLLELPSQHSDHFSTNSGYRTGSYFAGEIFLEQLKYLIGNQLFYKGMKRYFNTWKMRHPEPNDFLRVMEKVSGLQLHWYYRYWINTTKRIDYGIGEIVDDGNATFVTLERIGEFPMPVDLLVTYKNGGKELFYITTNELLGRKPAEEASLKRVDLDAWPWVYSTYTFKIGHRVSEIEDLEIDPSQRMADVNRKNNKVVIADLLHPFKDPTK